MRRRRQKTAPALSWAWGLLVHTGGSPLRGIGSFVVPGCALRIADDGRAALGLLARRPTDLVLIDPQLPDMDDLTVLRRIRSVDPAVPIIVVDRRRAASLRGAVVSLGLAAYFTTPLDVPGLIRQATLLLRGEWSPQRKTSRGSPNRSSSNLGTRILHRIRENAEPSLTVGALAREVGLSPRRLHDIMHSSYGTAPKVYMLRTRVARVLALLRETDQPLKAIASSIGYYDVAHLSHDVSRLTGAPPGCHRRFRRPSLSEREQ